MHAPMDVEWLEWKGPVFVGAGGPEDAGDTSPDPIQHVLLKVIEATNRVLVSNADLDMEILTDGTLLAIQNACIQFFRSDRLRPMLILKFSR